MRIPPHRVTWKLKKKKKKKEIRKFVFWCPIDGKKEEKYVGPEPGARPFAESIDTQSKEQEQQSTTNSNIHVASESLNIRARTAL